MLAPPRATNFRRVNLTVKSDYAARAVLLLARHFPGGDIVRAEQIATEQHIPPKYLVQLLIELKAHQIVRSERGKDGGYQLAKPPAEITLGEILRAMHGDFLDTPALHDATCPPELRATWEQLKTAAHAAADAVNFQQLLDASADKAKMYYI
ncbi:MAG: hypothetical protein RLZZ350_115 [Verrucomicrobiota bacterium]